MGNDIRYMPEKLDQASNFANKIWNAAKFVKMNSVADEEVIEFKDYSKGIDGLPKSDVLKFFLKDNAWFAVRPSGTEPKIKFYFGVCESTKENAKKAIDALKKTVLGFAG